VTVNPARRNIPISTALTDKALFGPWMSDPSWANWRTVLAATFGLKLTDPETEFFRSVTGGRDAPTEQAKEAWFIVGRRAGKDSVASVIAAYMAATFKPRGAKLRPGERAVVACLAVDREQANIVRKMISGLFEAVPVLQNLVVKEVRDGLELSNGVDITVTTSEFRAVRGRSYLCVIADEIAFWRDDQNGSLNPDREIIRGLRPGMATIPGSLLIGISSPHKRSGLAFERWRDYHGKSDPRILVVHAPTVSFHDSPEIRTEIEHAKREDPVLARSDYEAEWRDDLAGYVSRELIEAAIDPVPFHPYRSRISYVAFYDAAEGVSASGDAFTASIAHADGDVAAQDWAFERRPPFNTSDTIKEIASVLKSYRIREIMGDSHAAGFAAQEFARHGIRVTEPCPLSKSELYLDLLSRFSGHKVRLIDNTRQTNQFVALERKTVSGGSDRFDHPRAGHDDIANAAAGALWRAVSKRSLTASDYHKVNNSPRMRGDVPWRNSTGITDVAIAARSFPSTDAYAQSGGDRG
jgi:hypothetical protein